MTRDTKRFPKTLMPNDITCHYFRALSRKPERDEQGSSLILALVFMIVSSLVVLSLAGLAKNDLINTVNFTRAHSVQSAANSAAELAIDHVRYNFTPQTLNASPPQPCWTTSPTQSQVTLNGVSVDVWCSTAWSPLSENTRTVTFDACTSGVTASSCEVSPLLSAVVTFDDFKSPITAISTAQCSTTCGVSMNIDSWVFDTVPPTVQSISPTSGSTSGGTVVTITGTGFVSGAIVTFTSTNASSNVVINASRVTVESQTTITATTPQMASGISYYATVTTPSGTSAYGPTFN